MKGFRFSALIAASSLLVVSAGQAEGVRAGLATVSDVDGVVLVSDGSRFSTATVGDGVVEGSRLLTMESATAIIIYGDGCKLEVSPNTMVVFRKADECANNSVDSEVAGRQYASLGAVRSGAASASAGSVATTVAAVNSTGAIGSPSRGSAEPGFLGVPAAGVLAGAATLAVGVYFVASDNDNSSQQVSPETF